MAKRIRKNDRTTLDSRLREGYGQGHGQTYKPWLVIQDVPSRGQVSRIKGWKTGRVHHFFSLLERHFFYILEWSPFVTDIREQFPLLPLSDTLKIAHECQLAHPADPRSKEPIVMTTDFLITLVSGQQTLTQARAIKPATQLSSQRVLEKLEIERCYWQSKGTDWGLVTEREIPQILVHNLEFLHGYFDLSLRLPDLLPSEINTAIQVLSGAMLQNCGSLRQTAHQCDRQLGFEPGTCLSLAYFLIASKRWRIDLLQPLEPGKSLPALQIIALELATQPQPEEVAG